MELLLKWTAQPKNSPRQLVSSTVQAGTLKGDSPAPNRAIFVVHGLSEKTKCPPELCQSEHLLPSPYQTPRKPARQELRHKQFRCFWSVCRSFSAIKSRLNQGVEGGRNTQQNACNCEHRRSSEPLISIYACKKTNGKGQACGETRGTNRREFPYRVTVIVV